MILIALGGNLTSPVYGEPREILTAALAALPRHGIGVAAVSRWYRTAPVPASDQPWFVNGVAAVRFDGEPADLLARLHRIEAEFGRVRIERWSARVLDLDLLAFAEQVRGWKNGAPVEDGRLVLPHPRLHERLFVLRPLLDVAPDWRHPVLGRTAQELLEALPPGQQIEPVPDGD
jgi:2-amino-4-hydroxy-6-hydroxymethyldihydropteridine diphosphokinase